MLGKILRVSWLVAFISAALFQFAMICWGLDELGLHWLLLGIGAFILTLVPLAGQAVAIYGLKTGFDISWIEAIGAVVGVAILLMALHLLASWAEDDL
jgi:hypothetical protein